MNVKQIEMNPIGIILKDNDMLFLGSGYAFYISEISQNSIVPTYILLSFPYVLYLYMLSSYCAMVNNIT